MKETINKIKEYKKGVSSNFVDMGGVSAVLTYALLTGEHCLLSGRPGTAKSAVARGFLSNIGRASVFSKQMSKDILSIYDIFLEEYETQTGKYISMRKANKMLNILKASAFLNARAEVIMEDLKELQYALCSNKDEATIFSAILARNIMGADLIVSSKEELAKIKKEIAETAPVEGDSRTMSLAKHKRAKALLDKINLDITWTLLGHYLDITWTLLGHYLDITERDNNREATIKLTDSAWKNRIPKIVDMLTETGNTLCSKLDL